MGVPLTVIATENETAQQYGSLPHGGTLVNLLVTGGQAQDLAREAKSLPVRELTSKEASDVEMLAIGAYSPLTGFMKQDDYNGVVDTMHLASGIAWSMPITLSVTGDLAGSIQAGGRLALSVDGRRYAILDIEEIFTRDKQHEAQQVFRTTEEAHPGVATVYAEGDTLVGGRVTVFGDLPAPAFPAYYRPPAETRRIFAEKAWRTIVGFQTRNPVHRAHEYITKCALEIVDGLLLHPLVGATKSDDIPAIVRMRCYEILLENYYPENRVLLAINPAAMRYGGPREAIFHALIRKNFGCTHFIVGRDHAGVGGYYGPYDSQHIFSDFKPGELGIQPLFFENSFYCNVCGQYATEKTCAHPVEDHVSLSGTKVRETLRRGEALPPVFTRPPVAEFLAEAMREK
jgi:sulfate adenylyltransferase